MQMKCKKCKTNMFTIDVRQDCDDCEYNGWISKDGYEYSEPPEDVERNMVEQEGECYHGTAYGCGCWLIKCTECGHIEHVSAVEGV